MNIGITGASGFVGKNLSAYLSSNKDFSVTAIDRHSEDFCQVMTGNLNAVVHLAGKAHDLKNVSSPEEYYESNYDLTRHIYDAFLRSNAHTFIFLSSVKAAADKVDGLLTEDITPNPETPYGKSKLLAEQYIQSQNLPAGKRYFILRPCIIHGPGNKGNINLLYSFVKKGIPYPLAGFNNERSFLGVKNLTFIIGQLIMRNVIEGGIYNIADDMALSTNQLVDEISRTLNLKPKKWKLNPRLIRTLAKVGDILHLPLTTERLDKLTENYLVSNKKIKQAINKEWPLTTLEGLEITVNHLIAGKLD